MKHVIAHIKQAIRIDLRPGDVALVFNQGNVDIVTSYVQTEERIEELITKGQHVVLVLNREPEAEAQATHTLRP